MPLIMVIERSWRKCDFLVKGDGVKGEILLADLWVRKTLK